MGFMFNDIKAKFIDTIIVQLIMVMEVENYPWITMFLYKQSGFPLPWVFQAVESTVVNHGLSGTTGPVISTGDPPSWFTFKNK